MSRAVQPAPATSPAHPPSARVRRLAPPAHTRAAADHLTGEPSGEPGLLRCGDLVLDESRWTVHRADAPVELSPTEFRLLACLMRHQGRTLSRDQLLRQVWGWERADGSQIVETYVSYLRRKLDRLGPPLIHTRRGVGYTLRCPETSPGTRPLDPVTLVRQGRGGPSEGDGAAEGGVQG